MLNNESFKAVSIYYMFDIDLTKSRIHDTLLEATSQLMTSLIMPNLLIFINSQFLCGHVSGRVLCCQLKKAEALLMNPLYW